MWRGRWVYRSCLCIDPLQGIKALGKLFQMICIIMNRKFSLIWVRGLFKIPIASSKKGISGIFVCLMMIWVVCYIVGRGWAFGHYPHMGDGSFHTLSQWLSVTLLCRHQMRHLVLSQSMNFFNNDVKCCDCIWVPRLKIFLSSLTIQYLSPLHSWLFWVDTYSKWFNSLIYQLSCIWVVYCLHTDCSTWFNISSFFSYWSDFTIVQ